MRTTRFSQAIAIITLTTAACSTAPLAEPTAQTASALASNDQILGFEDVSAWSTSAGQLAASTTVVEGRAALAVSGLGSATANVRSVPLTAFSWTTNQVSFYLRLPTQQPNPSWFGSVELYFDAPSRSVNSALIVHRDLTGMPLGSYQKITATVPSWVASRLAGGTINDLSFRFAFTVPAGPQTYLLDALRFEGAPRTAQFDTFAGGGTPADPDIAVGPTLVGAITQLFATFHRRDGSVDHQFAIPADRLNLNLSPAGDSKIVFDRQSGRWIISVLLAGPGDNPPSGVEFFVSTDATAQTWRSSLPIQEPRFFDDPNITVAGDKVVVAADHCVWVIPKAGLLAGNAPRVSTTTCSIQNGTQVWGVQYGATEPNTAYLAALSDDSHVNWISVTGTPAQGNVAVTQHILAIPTLVPSPPIVQRNGFELENGGVLAMWQNNHLWWSSTEGCGSVTCPRMFDINTSSNTVTSFDFSLPGNFLWSAVPGIDADGNMWALMSQLAPNSAPGLVVAGKMSNGQIWQPSIVVPGIDPYPFGRWGDYFGAAQDPSDGSVWAVGMYGAADPNYGNKVVHVLRP